MQDLIKYINANTQYGGASFKKALSEIVTLIEVGNFKKATDVANLEVTGYPSNMYLDLILFNIIESIEDLDS